MDRRSFLKTLGFGGIALTVGKPVAVVASALKELDRGQLTTRAWSTRITAGAPMWIISQLKITLEGPNHQPPRMLDFKAFAEYGQIGIWIRKPDAKPIQLGSGPVVGMMDWEMQYPFVLNGGHVLEVWITSGDPHRELPLLAPRFETQGWIGKENATMRDGRYWHTWATMNRVRLDHKQAIRAGLIPSTERPAIVIA